ncbi:uncharacterized protein VP01_5240g1 [Puccinia sorghi]|uniref:Fatty acid synthase subunit alpha acyl carrier domain-containing protein n=1 Tax=Puccinia sorghi TaxID=27349 RepID=A0A0L6UKI9_9BASI|nr:uncharacterized protein VP01_5240g1 [Puccinia sorghi]
MTQEILCICENIKETYYKYKVKVEAETTPPASNEPAAPSPAIVAAPTHVAVVAGPVAAVADEPLKAVKTLWVLVAQVPKKPLADLPLPKAIKDLVGGKSTLQNELLGSARAEFGLVPNKSEEMQAHADPGKPSDDAPWRLAVNETMQFLMSEFLKAGRDFLAPSAVADPMASPHLPEIL